MANVDTVPGADMSDSAYTRRGRIYAAVTRSFLGVVLVALEVFSAMIVGVIIDICVKASVWHFEFTVVAAMFCVVYVLVLRAISPDIFRQRRSFVDRCGLVTMSSLLSLSFLVFFAFAFKISGHYSRLNFAIFAIASYCAILLVDVGIMSVVRKIFAGTNLLRASVYVVTLNDFDYEAVAFDDSDTFFVQDRCAIHTEAADYNEICRQLHGRLQRQIASGRCDQIALLADWRDKAAIDTFVRDLGPLPAPVVLVTEPALSRLLQNKRVIIGTGLGVELQSAPLSLFDRVAKRMLDLFLASAALIILSPIMVITALVIVMETGRPILFRQGRRGFGGIPFQILKFRSMTVTENGRDIKQATRGDRRVTRFGKVLRSSSIDELPQLINVLRGEMSLVGPRPHAMAHDDHYDQIIERYAFRHHVKPGITGWAQINGHRGATETPEAMRARVEHDLWYINNWSLWLDIKILAITAVTVISHDNAY